MNAPVSLPLLVSGQRVVERGEFMERSARAATGFAALGVRENDTVAVMMRNDLAFLEASIGAIAARAYALPINWASKRDEVRFLLADSNARVLVIHADLLAQVEAALPPGIVVLPVETPPEVRAAYRLPADICRVPAGTTGWDEWLGAHEPRRGSPQPPRESMIYTSGTTGRPKGVRRLAPTPEQVRKLEELRAKMYGLVPGLRTIIPGPLHHIATNSFALRAAQIADRLVMMPRFDPEELLRLIAEHRPTALFMVPAMFMRLLALPAAVRGRYDLTSLELVVHGGAPCPPDVKQAMIDWWGPVIAETYGSTELGTIAWCDTPSWLAHRGTVGRPVDGTTIRILDGNGRPVPAGTPGEIFAHCDAYPDFTYHNRDDARQKIGRDGLASAGDVGYLDAEGYLYICDRMSDMVIFAGMNVYPAEIEAALFTLEGVRDCAVIGIPEAMFGESLLAIVVQDGSLDEAAVRRHLKERLADYKLPRRVEFRPALPRDATGKLRKRELRADYWQSTGRAI